jgi:hypothetical protein
MAGSWGAYFEQLAAEREGEPGGRPADLVAAADRLAREVVAARGLVVVRAATPRLALTAVEAAHARWHGGAPERVVPSAAGPRADVAARAAATSAGLMIVASVGTQVGWDEIVRVAADPDLPAVVACTAEPDPPAVVGAHVAAGDRHPRATFLHARSDRRVHPLGA